MYRVVLIYWKILEKRESLICHKCFHYQVKNYFLAAGMTAFGVAGAGAVGRHLSEQIIDGYTTLDVPSVDVKRHSEHYNGQTFLRERVKEVIG